MIRSFADAFTALIGNEGAYSSDSRDPGNWSGGAVGIGTVDGTMWGISAPVARRSGYRGDMRDLTLDQAREIAKREYWDSCQCDQFDPRIGFQVFDAAYNGGHPAQWLQAAAGVNPDGIIGAATVAAVRALDPDVVIMRFDAYRLRYLAGLAKWPDFGHGWANRIASNLLAASGL